MRTSKLSDLRRLCVTSDTLPSVLYLHNIQLPHARWHQPVAGGSFSDVYKAKKGTLDVAIKVIRTHQINDEEKTKKLKKVSSFVNYSLRHN